MAATLAARTTRILAIDRHLSMAEAYGLRLGEEEDLEFLGVLAKPSAAVSAVEKLRPDVCLIDTISGDAATGIRTLADIRESSPAVRCLVLVDVEGSGEALLAEILHFDPAGIFSKGDGLEQFVKAVRQVAEGTYELSPAMALQVSSARSLMSMFSTGERRVMAALARYGNKAEAASATFYSPETINTYLRRIRKRITETESKSEFRLPDLVAWARHHGFHHIEPTL